MLYSKSTGGFYDRAIHGACVPDDVVEITKEDHVALFASQALGKRIEADADGFPVAVEYVPTADELAAQKTAVLKQARTIRETVLDRLTGLRVNDIDPADTVSLAAIAVARTALKDLPLHPSVLAATDGASTKAAILARWYEIAATLSATAQPVASAFVGLGL